MGADNGGSGNKKQRLSGRNCESTRTMGLIGWAPVCQQEDQEDRLAPEDIRRLAAGSAQRGSAGGMGLVVRRNELNNR